MSDSNRVIWSEGLFLRPQHFQQQERFLEAYIEGRTAALHTNSWGFTELELERDLRTVEREAKRLPVALHDVILPTVTLPTVTLPAVTLPAVTLHDVTLHDGKPSTPARSDHGLSGSST